MNTPIYIVEEEKLRRNLALISDVARRTHSEWILAFKAFALWKTFPIFREYINSTTASSLSEARLALEEFGAKAHTYSPAYKDEEFDDIVRCSSHLTFNSLSQYERFHDRAGECSLGLRVNPEYSEVGTLLYNPCAPGTRFGVTADKLPEQLPKDIKGFHCHCHCESGADVFERTLQHVEEKFSKWFGQLEWINFGGGHLVTRKDYNIELLVRLMQGFHERYPHLKVILVVWWMSWRIRVYGRLFWMSALPVTCPTVWRCLISLTCAMPNMWRRFLTSHLSPLTSTDWVATAA